MLKVGLTGGLASGKSFIGVELERLGARVLQADKLGHLVLMPDGEAYQDVIDHFGRETLNSDGSIDRKKLGAIVFNDSNKLEQLNTLVHPHVFTRQKQFFYDVEADNPAAVAVVEAAVMVETGSYKNYDRLILVSCPRELQIERFIEREYSSRKEAESRLERQMPLEEKRGFADFLIDTSGTKNQTRIQVQDVYHILKREAQQSTTEVC